MISRSSACDVYSLVIADDVDDYDEGGRALFYDWTTAAALRHG